jgi:hypothetical protein
MKRETPEMQLERVLEILSAEIATASDAEVLEACADLRIQPDMKGSVAFLGVKGFVFPYRFWVLAPSDATTLAAPDDDPSDLTPRRQ